MLKELSSPLPKISCVHSNLTKSLCIHKKLKRLAVRFALYCIKEKRKENKIKSYFIIYNERGSKRISITEFVDACFNLKIRDEQRLKLTMRGPENYSDNKINTKMI
jgi:hypothetical protein